jgi:hypothetical protein
MTASSEYALELLREGASFTLYRGRQHGNPSPVLAVALAAEMPSPQSLRRLEHEYSLAAELDPAWAALPLALTRQEGRTILVLKDPGGEPLDSMNQLRTLQDLMDALAAVVPPEPPMLRTSAAHFSDFVGVPPEEIDIATLVDRKEAFREYLKERKYQKNSIRTFVNFTGVLVRKAEEFGWKRPAAIVPECWQQIYDLAPARGSRRIILRYGSVDPLSN